MVTDAMTDRTDGEATEADVEPRRTSRDVQREETRKRVYEAALAIFRRDGVAECRIEDVARLAGVSRGTFYFHFPTKEDVLTELLRESHERLAEAVRALPDDSSLDVVLDTVSRAIAAEWQEDARIFPDVAVVGLRISAPLSQEDDPFRIRDELAGRFSKAAEKLSGHAAPGVLADLFLVNQSAVALSWSARRSGSLLEALRGAAQIFLHGALA